MRKILKTKGLMLSAMLALMGAALTVQSHSLKGLDEELAAIFASRHKVMEDFGKSMKAFSNYLKHSDGDIVELSKRAGKIAENAKRIPAIFPPDTGIARSKESKAKEDIWTNWSEFVNAAKELEPLANDLKASFESGKRSAIASATKRLGVEGCRNCHQRFRQKRN